MNKLKLTIKNFLTELLFQIQINKEIVAKKPIEVHLSVTENCCLKCKMCDIWKIKNKQKNLDLKTAKKIIDKLENWLGSFQITFAGGEPFLNKDFIEIVKYASKKGLKTSTNSNGYIINETMAKKVVDSKISQIFFSIDGLEREHNFIRGKQDSFQRVEKAIKNLNKIKSSNKPKIFINSVISNNNLTQITKIITLAKKMKVSGINFQVIMPNFSGKYSDKWFNNNKLWPKDKKRIQKTINELLYLKNKYSSFILNSNIDFRNFKQYLLNPHLYQKNEKCFVGFNNFMVDSYGNMRLCYSMEIIGNILKENPKKLWMNDKARNCRNKIINCNKPCKLLPCNSVKISNLLKTLFINNS